MNQHSLPWLVTLALPVMCWSGSSSGVEVRPAQAEATLQTQKACSEKVCEFKDVAGDNLYRLLEDSLSRIFAGKTMYERGLTEKFEEILLSGISSRANLLAVVIARERVNQRGRGLPNGSAGSLGRPAMPHPSDVDREHQVQLINPKSGDEVKALDLGAFRPEDLALSESGELVLLVGRDLQLKTRELRILNARSGKLEHQQAVEPKEAVELAANGFFVGPQRWQIFATSGGRQRQFFSQDSYSIAEYTVECSGSLREPRFQAKAISVGEMKGATPELDQMLGSSLAVSLRNAGLDVLEREKLERVLDEQWLQTTGLTSEENAAQLGKIGNPVFFAFGALELTGTTLSLTVRLVAVETAALTSSCQLTCRDCSESEYAEGVKFLVKAWTEE